MGAGWLVWRELDQDGVRQRSWRAKARSSVRSRITSLNCCLVSRGLFQFTCVSRLSTLRFWSVAKASIFMKVVVGELGKENACETEKLEELGSQLST